LGPGPLGLLQRVVRGGPPGEVVPLGQRWHRAAAAGRRG
jgi:hypothetical protein